MLAWNSHEAGKIIETYKAYEHKPPDNIMEKQETDSQVQVRIVEVLPTLLSLHDNISTHVDNLISITNNCRCRCSCMMRDTIVLYAKKALRGLDELQVIVLFQQKKKSFGIV